MIAELSHSEDLNRTGFCIMSILYLTTVTTNRGEEEGTKEREGVTSLVEVERKEH